jgi:hypothetical protein
MWSNHSEWDTTWEREDYLLEVYPTIYEKWYVIQISGQDFYKGEGYNTLGVKLAFALALHEHKQLSFIHKHKHVKLAVAQVMFHLLHR